MGRKKKPAPDDPDRSSRFVELATEISDEDAEQRFEQAMKRIAVKKRQDQEATSDKQSA